MSRRLPLGQTEHQGYDDFGRLAWKMDFAGQVTAFWYDGYGRLQLKDLYARWADYPGAPAERVSYAHDQLGRLRCLYEPRGR